MGEQRNRHASAAQSAGEFRVPQQIHQPFRRPAQHHAFRHRNHGGARRAHRGLPAGHSRTFRPLAHAPELDQRSRAYPRLRAGAPRGVARTHRREIRSGRDGTARRGPDQYQPRGAFGQHPATRTFDPRHRHERRQLGGHLFPRRAGHLAGRSQAGLPLCCLEQQRGSGGRRSGRLGCRDELYIVDERRQPWHGFRSLVTQHLHHGQPPGRDFPRHRPRGLGSLCQQRAVVVGLPQPEQCAAGGADLHRAGQARFGRLARGGGVRVGQQQRRDSFQIFAAVVVPDLRDQR